jgi:hypothetical protein
MYPDDRTFHRLLADDNVCALREFDGFSFNTDQDFQLNHFVGYDVFVAGDLNACFLFGCQDS